MRNLLLAMGTALGLVGIALPSQAADLAVRKAPIYKAPAAIPAPILNPWTGLYAGFNAGYQWERFGGGDIPSVNTGDGAFGVQVGYNWMAGNWLYGLEGDIQGTTGHVGTSNGTCAGVTCQLNARINGFGTIRGRLGTLIGPASLIYLTGGAAFINSGAEVFIPGFSAENKGVWKGGYAIGGGYEQMLWARWSGKVEYLYMAADGPSLAVGGVSRSVDNREHLFRVGLNYHF